MLRNLLSGGLLLLAGCAVPSSRSLRPVDPPTKAQAGLVLPQPLQAVGTEPFWAATLEGGTLTYRTPADQAGTRIAVRRLVSDGAVVVAGRLGAAAVAMRITSGPCSDGMSDTVYRYKVELTIGVDRRLGCAR